MAAGGSEPGAEMTVKKNILIVGSVLSGGGAERVIANIAKHIDQTKYNLTICHLKKIGEIGQELTNGGFRVVGVVPSTGSLGRYFSFLQLRRIVTQNKIDLIHSHDTHALVDTALVRSTLPSVKMVHTFHFGNYPYGVKRYMFLERVFSHLASRLVAVGIEQCKALRKAYRIRADRIVIVQNGVELSGAKPDMEWRERLAKSGRPVIGAMSTFIEQKGLTYLLDTAQRMKQQGTEAVFVIVGDGPLRNELEEKCRRLELADRVFFAGWKQNAAATMLPLFDVFFQTSLWEAMSLAVLEAMAAGRPVVATDVGDNRHVIVNGENGEVVPAKDVEAMTAALTSLVNSDEQRVRYGEAGKNRYSKLYAARTMALRYEELYSDVLE